MFNQAKKSELVVGDIVVVGYTVDGKFFQNSAGVKPKVVSLFKDPSTQYIQINLDAGEHGKSRVYSHDEGKTWQRLSNFN